MAFIAVGTFILGMLAGWWITWLTQDEVEDIRRKEESRINTALHEMEQQLYLERQKEELRTRTDAS